MGEKQAGEHQIIYVGDRVAFHGHNMVTEYGVVFRIKSGARATNVSIKTDDDTTFVRDITCVRKIADTRGDPDYSVNHVS